MAHEPIVTRGTRKWSGLLCELGVIFVFILFYVQISVLDCDFYKIYV